MSARASICTADEAVLLIRNGATLVSGGFVGAGHPVALTAALERLFLTGGDCKSTIGSLCVGGGILIALSLER